MSANMKIHYDVVVEVLLRLKIAVWNPDFVQGAPGIKGEEIFIVKPERLFSWDETKVALKMQAESKAKAERMVLAGPMDDGSIMASNSSVAASGIGSSLTSSHSLPAFFVLACALFAPTTCDGGPMSTLINLETNWPFADCFAMSDTGLVKNDITVAYLQHCVLGVVTDVSPENPVVGICDGFRTTSRSQFSTSTRSLKSRLSSGPCT